MATSHCYTNDGYSFETGHGAPPITRLAALLRLWTQHAAARSQLRELEERLLQDIGVSREAALAESRKPFWKA